VSYQLKVERQAFKQLAKLPQPKRTRLTEAILSLEEDAFPPGKKCKQLESTGGPVRLRDGDYRVLYEVIGDEIHVLAVVPRGSLERWLRCV
jgi:mRNA-degrading endonuclease RelE of RelBE toxin-antitoxin system